MLIRRDEMFSSYLAVKDLAILYRQKHCRVEAVEYREKLVNIQDEQKYTQLRLLRRHAHRTTSRLTEMKCLHGELLVPTSRDLAIAGGDPSSWDK